MRLRVTLLTITHADNLFEVVLPGYLFNTDFTERFCDSDGNPFIIL